MAVCIIPFFSLFLQGLLAPKHFILQSNTLFLFSSAGILHKGNGENVFISQQPLVISTVMGTGAVRAIPCPNCNGPAVEQKLFAPIALACGSDGSVYVGDFNYIRRILPNGFSISILELRSAILNHQKCLNVFLLLFYCISNVVCNLYSFKLIVLFSNL